MKRKSGGNMLLASAGDGHYWQLRVGRPGSTAGGAAVRLELP
jgi:hypothetical protein